MVRRVGRSLTVAVLSNAAYKLNGGWNPPYGLLRESWYWVICSPMARFYGSIQGGKHVHTFPLPGLWGTYCG